MASRFATRSSPARPLPANRLTSAVPYDLVTFNRNGAGNLTAINDRYGRSIVYRVSTFATANVPSGWAQSYVEVDHVSQIVTTGTTNPPDRYAYGYYNVPNGEFSEQVPFLHTITVPSPTGTGNATATIDYGSFNAAGIPLQPIFSKQ